MKKLLAAALLSCLALPLRAEPLPEGSFLLGSFIWPDHLLPRSVLLEVEGGEMRVNFVHPLPLDMPACDTEGRCDSRVEAARAQVSVEAGVLELTAIDVDEAAAIEPSTETHLGVPQHAAYTNAVLTLLQAARFEPSEDGFRLTSAGTPLEFYRIAPGDALAIIALPVVFQESIAQIGGCDVRALAPLLAKPDPSPEEARLAAIVRGFGTMVEFDFEARRLAPALGTPGEADELAGRKAQAASRMPGMIAGLFRTPEEGGIEEFRSDIGLRMFRDDAEALDGAIAAYGAALPDMVAFFRHIGSLEPRPRAQAICADPWLGFAP